MMRHIRIKPTGSDLWIEAVVANVEQLREMARMLEASPRVEQYIVSQANIGITLPHVYGWGPDRNWPKWTKD